MHRLIFAIGIVASLVGANRSLAAAIEINSDELFECSSMNIRYSGFPITASAKGNWLAVAEQGSPRSVNTYRFKYLPISENGHLTISTLGLVPFKPYELRAFFDWDGTRSYVIQDSVEFFVLPKPGCEPALLTRIPGTINTGEKLKFSFQGLQQNDSNWVSVATPDQVVHGFVKFVYLPAKKKGNFEIDTSALPAGTYELRLFQDWKNSKDYFLYHSVEFRIQ